jgi:ubiquinone/menaquinone biosynthesis C-methylase UbiE
MTDWNQIWKDAMIASRLTKDNYYDQEERAECYDKSDKIWIDGVRRVTALDPDPSWTVLDIGSGPGNLALPLARRVRHVTIVEPSRHMVRRLDRHLAEEKLSNMRIITSRWEDVSMEDVGIHDIVISSYSLHFENILDALIKMNILARQRVYLYWFAGITSMEQPRVDLYPLIYGREYAPLPKCNILYNVLYDLGLYPDVEVLHATAKSEEYANYANALSYLKSTLNLSSKDHDHDEILYEYIEDRWRTDDGRIVLDESTVNVKLSWRPTKMQ